VFSVGEGDAGEGVMENLEINWFACTDPKILCDELKGRVSARRERLLAVAICKRIKGLLIDPYTLHTLDLIEAMSESDVTAEELARVRDVVVEDWDIVEYSTEFDDAQRRAIDAVLGTTDEANPLRETISAAVSAINFRGTQKSVLPAFVEIIQDVGGNPFRPVTFAPAWRTSTVLCIADAIYADRAFGNLPILADALEDAGCDHADILSHCRGPGPHVRGCWVVDLVLGKS
jgi:hypothetical protein